MRRAFRIKPSPAMVIACAALLVALGGTSIAAVNATVPNNSVGTPQLKNNAVTGIKVKNRTLRAVDFALGQIPKGPRGLAGPAGPAGPAGAAGAAGATGPAGPFVDTLPSGKTLRGNFAGRARTTLAGQDMQIDITFAFPLASAPAAHYIASGAAAPAACPGNAGSPSAAAGHLCVYESAPAINATGRVFDPIGGADGEANRYGGGVAASATAVGDFRVRGSWAVTAP